MCFVFMSLHLSVSYSQDITLILSLNVFTDSLFCWIDFRSLFLFIHIIIIMLHWCRHVCIWLFEHNVLFSLCCVLSYVSGYTQKKDILEDIWNMSHVHTGQRSCWLIFPLPALHHCLPLIDWFCLEHLFKWGRGGGEIDCRWRCDENETCVPVSHVG